MNHTEVFLVYDSKIHFRKVYLKWKREERNDLEKPLKLIFYMLKRH